MRAHYLQHVPFEGLGSIGPWLAAAGYAITDTQLHAGDSLPDMLDFDLLVVMGGPMSVNDELLYPWLVEEKRFIREAVECGKAVLGICLGAQLIASALGARVYPNREKEIGWFPIQGTASDDTSAFRFPSDLTVFHWHGETFELPVGAMCLARSVACENQAYQLGERVIGLQFHLETTAESAAAIVANCRDELVPAAYVQTEPEILSAQAERYASINRMMGRVLAFLQT